MKHVIKAFKKLELMQAKEQRKEHNQQPKKKLKMGGKQ